MNDIIKNIESAQLKAEVPEFRVGDTVRDSGYDDGVSPTGGFRTVYRRLYRPV